MADSIRNMTEEELRRARAQQRDPSDPLAWGPEKGVETDETTWDLLQFVPLGKVATRLAGYLRKKGVTTAEKGAEAIVKEAVAEAPKVAPKALPEAPPKDVTVSLGKFEKDLTPKGEIQLLPEEGIAKPPTTHRSYYAEYKDNILSGGGGSYRYNNPPPDSRIVAEEWLERVMNGLDDEAILDTIKFYNKEAGRQKPRPETLEQILRTARDLRGAANPNHIDKLRFVIDMDSAINGFPPITNRDLLEHVLRSGGDYNDAAMVYGFDYFPNRNGRDRIVARHLGKAKDAVRQLRASSDPNEISAAHKAFDDAVFRADEAISQYSPALRQHQPTRPEPPPPRVEKQIQPKKSPPEAIREAMRRNQENKSPLAKVEREDIVGRPWPEFLTDRVPIEHNGERFWMDSRGNVFLTKTEPTPIYTTGTYGGVDDVYGTNFSFYTSDRFNTKTNPELRGLAAKARQKLSEVHGNVVSDIAGNSSTAAQKSWMKTPGTQDIRSLPRGPMDSLNYSKFILKHPEGGNIKGIVEELKKMGFGQHITEEEVAAYLKHYGGNALVGAAGLAGFAKYLQDKDK